jgi:hypothetical protein
MDFIDDDDRWILFTEGNRDFQKPIYHHHHHQSSNRANKENWVTPALMRAMLQKNMHRLKREKRKKENKYCKASGR